MPFQTAIQILKGANTGTGSGQACAVDWDNGVAWMAGAGLNLTVLDFKSNQLFSAPFTYYGITVLAPVGLDAFGNAYFPITQLHNGGVVHISGADPSFFQTGLYANNTFGGGGFANVDTELTTIPGGSQFMLDTGVGGGILGSLEQINVIQGTNQLLNQLWPVSQKHGFVVGAPEPTGFGYLVNSPSDLTTTQELTISVVNCYPTQSVTHLATISMAAIGAAWGVALTSIGVAGLCMDQTDGGIIMAVNANGVPGIQGIIKFDVSTLALDWGILLPTRANIDNTWNLSEIDFGFLFVLTPSNFGSPPVTLTTINTRTGQFLQQTTGLSGLTVFGAQQSSDRLGVVAAQLSYTSGAGAPIPLNGTPNFAQNWSLLYVAPPLTTPNSVVTGQRIPLPWPHYAENKRLIFYPWDKGE